MSEKSDAINSFTFSMKELTEDEKIKLRCEARARYYADQQDAVETGFDYAFQLYQLLKDQDRLADFEHCQSDLAFREKLLKELRLK